MKHVRMSCIYGLSLCLMVSALASAQAKSGVLSSEEVKKVVPTAYFFEGRSASVQVRNSAGFRNNDNKLVLAGLVDTSGYSSDVQAKYQGLLITEVKLEVGGKELAPGQYGFGFSKEGKVVLMDVGGNDLFSVSSEDDDKLARPVPLKIVADGETFRLYAGRKWVSLKTK